MKSPWGWNPATLWAVGIAVLAVAAIIVVVRDGADRRATRERFANLVRVQRDRSDTSAVSLVLTNLGEQPIFLRAVLLWTDMRVQPRDLLADRSLVTTRWPFILGRVQLRCEHLANAGEVEVASKERRVLTVPLQAADLDERVLLAAVGFVDADGRTHSRREDDRVLSGERVSPRMWRRTRAGAPIT